MKKSLSRYFLLCHRFFLSLPFVVFLSKSAWGATAFCGKCGKSGFCGFCGFWSFGVTDEILSFYLGLTLSCTFEQEMREKNKGKRNHYKEKIEFIYIIYTHTRG
ncbi:MAG: hypothetical protein J5905_07270 [Prevotella sp.]|nr:hypothetical protein [Prevotella sp.]